MNILTAKEIGINFGGVIAIDNVDIAIEKNTIHAIIGTNGSGKTTFFNIITGVYKATKGSILFKDKKINFPFTPQDLLITSTGAAIFSLLIVIGLNSQELWDLIINQRYRYKESFDWYSSLSILNENIFKVDNILPFILAFIFFEFTLLMLLNAKLTGTQAANKRGLARTFQNIRLFNELTAIENLIVAAKSKSSVELLQLLEFVDLADKAQNLASSFSYGEQRRLEIARALATEPEILFLDEPAAGMNESEGGKLKDLIKKIKNKGVTVMLIEHHMRVVMEISDKITVLNQGKVIAEGTPEEIKDNKSVIVAYLGE